MAHSFADHFSRVLCIVGADASAVLLASAPEVEALWGSMDRARRVTWPLALRLGRRP
jgi:hypothetical protein